MIKVAPQAQIALQHTALHLALADDGHIAVLSSAGIGTFLGPDLTVLSGFSIPQQPWQATLSPDSSLLAVTASEGITFYATASFEKLHYMNGAYRWCLFGSENLLWTSSRFTPLTAVLEAWDFSKKTRIAKVKIADPFSESTFVLFPHPLPYCVVLWAGAGQDGQMLFWASLSGETIQVTRFDQQHFTSLPAFSPSGKEFLITNEGTLYRYTYPNGPLLAQTDQLAEEKHVGEDVSYLDDKHALLASPEGKLFIVDVIKMEVVHEVGLAGEELPPVSHFVRLADGRFLSVHRDFGGKNIDQACDGLAIWPAPAV